MKDAKPFLKKKKVEWLYNDILKANDLICKNSHYYTKCTEHNVN